MGSDIGGAMNWDQNGPAGPASFQLPDNMQTPMDIVASTKPYQLDGPSGDIVGSTRPTQVNTGLIAGSTRPTEVWVPGGNMTRSQPTFGTPGFLDQFLGSGLNVPSMFDSNSPIGSGEVIAKPDNRAPEATKPEPAPNSLGSPFTAGQSSSYRRYGPGRTALEQAIYDEQGNLMGYESLN